MSQKSPNSYSVPHHHGYSNHRERDRDRDRDRDNLPKGKGDRWNNPSHSGNWQKDR